MSFIQPDAEQADLTYAARSAPVLLRFKETRPHWWYFDLRVVSTFHHDRELCWQHLGAETRRVLYSCRMFDRPVPLLVIPQQDDVGLTGWIYAEIESPEPFETPAVRFPLGGRLIRWENRRWPDDPAREACRLLQCLLQGPPEQAVEELVRSVAREAAGREA